MSLPEPSFISRDINAITTAMVASYEASTGKTLLPAQVERVLIDLIAYRESLLRIAIQEAAKQNLVAYAAYPMLDYLGQLVGCSRLDGEPDDAYRERIKLAPESFSNAGSSGAYRYHAKSADASIVDVAVTSPSAGVVNIYPLIASGAPDQALLDKVAAACNADNVRPLTDSVAVIAPGTAGFTIAVTITPYLWPEPATIQAAAVTALTALVASRRLVLGQDVTLSAITAAAHVSGAYKVAVTSPAADVVVGSTSVAVCAGITVTMAEPVNG